MKYTNKFGLPEEIVAWLMHDDYDYEPGVYSATTLMKPVRAVVLTARHYEDLELDVSDMLASRYGTALHDSFEKVAIPNTTQEERMYATIKIKGTAYKISGKPDIIRDDINQLKDIKSTSVWNYIYKNKIEEYTTQMSIYRYLASKNGIDLIDTAQVLYLFTDWARSKAKSNPDYPPTRAASGDIDLWPLLKTKKYIRGRIDLFQHHLDNTPDDELPFCTDEELWKQPDKWAVMKIGQKRAKKVFDEERNAKLFIDTQIETSPPAEAKKLYVEERPGVVNRCNYCAASEVCNQCKQLREQGVVAPQPSKGTS